MRFLCLHGKGTNSEVFEWQTAAIRYELGSQHEYEFLNGSILCEPYPGTEALLMGPKGKLETAYSWFDDTHQSIVSVLLDLAEYLTLEGPFDAIMGFSQGATLAATFITHAHKINLEQSYSMTFKFAVFICPGPVWNCEPSKTDHKDEELKHYLNPAVVGEVIELPSAVIWGSLDKFSEGGRLMEGLCDKTSREVFVHPGGHDIPRTGEALQGMTRAVKKVIEKTLFFQ